MSLGNLRPFCLGLDLLMHVPTKDTGNHHINLLWAQLSVGNNPFRHVMTIWKAVFSCQTATMLANIAPSDCITCQPLWTQSLFSSQHRRSVDAVCRHCQQYNTKHYRINLWHFYTYHINVFICITLVKFFCSWSRPRPCLVLSSFTCFLWRNTLNMHLYTAQMVWSTWNVNEFITMTS